VVPTLIANAFFLPRHLLRPVPEPGKHEAEQKNVATQLVDRK